MENESGIKQFNFANYLGFEKNGFGITLLPEKYPELFKNPKLVEAQARLKEGEALFSVEYRTKACSFEGFKDFLQKDLSLTDTLPWIYRHACIANDIYAKPRAFEERKNISEYKPADFDKRINTNYITGLENEDSIDPWMHTFLAWKIVQSQLGDKPIKDLGEIQKMGKELGVKVQMNVLHRAFATLSSKRVVDTLVETGKFRKTDLASEFYPYLAYWMKELALYQTCEDKSLKEINVFPALVQEEDYPAPAVLPYLAHAQCEYFLELPARLKKGQNYPPAMMDSNLRRLYGLFSKVVSKPEVEDIDRRTITMMCNYYSDIATNLINHFRTRVYLWDRRDSAAYQQDESNLPSVNSYKDKIRAFGGNPPGRLGIQVKYRLVPGTE